MSWLLKRGVVEKVSTNERKMPVLGDRRRHSDSYPVSIYQMKETTAPADFAALNRAVGVA